MKSGPRTGALILPITAAQRAKNGPAGSTLPIMTPNKGENMQYLILIGIVVIIVMMVKSSK